MSGVLFTPTESMPPGQGGGSSSFFGWTPMFPRANGEDIIVHPYSGTEDDELGDQVSAFGEDRLVQGCGVEANGSTSEPREANRSQSIAEYRIFAPPDIAVSPRDEVTVRGIRCTVEGDPNAGRARNAFTGWTPGCEFVVRRVEG